jgi:hypothetical protein
MNKKIEVDSDFLLKLAKGFDALKRRVDHLESHLHDDPEPSQNLQCNIIFQNNIAPKNRAAYSQQFQAELMSLMQEYGVYSFEGTYQRK